MKAIDVCCILGLVIGAVVIGCKQKDDTSTTTSGPTNSPLCTNNAAIVKANLGTLRSALSIYYGDTQGFYPTDITKIVPKYISAIPSIVICNESNAVAHVASNAVTNVNPITSNDAGGWVYDNQMLAPAWGTILVNSAGKSPDGVAWTSY